MANLSAYLCLYLIVLWPDALFSETAQVSTEGDQTLFASPENGGARRWQAVSDRATQFKKPTPDAIIITEFDAGAVLSSFGCVTADDLLWCEVRPLQGGPRGHVQAVHLRPARGSDGDVLRGVDDSKKRATRRDFDDRAVIACAQEQGHRLRDCTARVARGTGGDATVVVQFPNGFARQLYFVHRTFTSASATMSGTGTDTDWQNRDGTHLIRVDDQRYEVPDSFVFGE